MQSAQRLAAWCLLTVVAQAAVSPSLICLQSCQAPLASVRFDSDVNGTALALLPCDSILRATSIYLCLDIYCSKHGRDVGLAAVNETCKNAFGENAPDFSIIDTYDSDKISKLPRLDYDESPQDASLSEPILPTARLFEAWRGTFGSTSYVWGYHTTFGWYMGIFWAIAIGFRAFFHMMPTFLRKLTGSSPSFAGSGLLLTSRAWFQSFITVPATFGYRRAQNFSLGTAPPRLESLIILGFFIMNVYCSVAGYMFVDDNIYFPSTTKQFLRFVSDRTGTISFANFPLMWVFGMRNNILIGLTGWDFGTFSNFHRWIARIATVHAVVHSVGYTAIILREGGWSYFLSWWSLWFWWAGEMATVFMCFIIAFSFHWIRRQQYEVFLLLHIGLSLAVLLTMLGHVSIFDAQFDALFWAPMVIWILDRLARVSRVLAFNRRFWATRARITYNADADIVRVDIDTSAAMYAIKPGVHFYITDLGSARFWESHPFTVALPPRPTASGSRPPSEDYEPLLPTRLDGERDIGLERGRSFSMTFYIRPYDSFTGRLKAKARASWPEPASLRVLVDGPYGHTQPLDSFDHILFVVGGSGIVVPLSYARDLSRGDGGMRTVEIHWAARQPGFAEEVLNGDDKGSGITETASVYLYNTSPSPSARVHPRVQQVAGKLNCREIVTAAVAKSQHRRLGIVSCGPARMADDVRCAVAEVLREQPSHVEYFEESFQW